MIICVSESSVLKRAADLPVSYLDDCRAAATIRPDKTWCFPEADFIRIRKKYRGYASSVTNEIPDGPISGCCDRADQY